VSLNHLFLTSGSEVVPHGIWGGRSAVTKGITVAAPFSVVPSDLVGYGVDEFKVVRKGTGSDLVVVIRVAPSTEPGRWRIIEDCCVREVGTGVCGAEQSAWPKTRGIRSCRLTFRPVPVRLSSREVAFGPQRVLKIVEVGTVPRHEETGEMNLSGKKGSE